VVVALLTRLRRPARPHPLLLALAAGVVLGCFSPKKPECAFSCVEDGLCPADYHCANDGLCHRDDGQGICTLPPQTDAGADAPGDADALPTDGGDDAP
jgi:hypothetical protein